MLQNKSETCWIISRFSQLDKKQNITINPISDDDISDVATVAINYGKTEKKFAQNIIKYTFYT